MLPACGDFHASPDGRAVRGGADKIDHDAVIPVAAIVSRRRGSSIKILHDHVHNSIFVRTVEDAATALAARIARPAYPWKFMVSKPKAQYVNASSR
jgi:hypothetical protein